MSSELTSYGFTTEAEAVKGQCVFTWDWKNFQTGEVARLRCDQVHDGGLCQHPHPRANPARPDENGDPIQWTPPHTRG